jgi:glycolate oxidase FAD binding subunit
MNCGIDGISFAIEQPASLDELRQLVRDAAARGDAIYPIGGRTMLDFGLPPARDGIALQTTRLDRVIDYPSRDMTITVEVGIRLAKLQEILRAEGQRLPVDVPRAAEATLGGAIATNVSGPRRHGFGTFRDYVIGISVVDAAGNETKAGGRVVKNVAGYDLCKLYTGSLGTLGIITQVTLKLKPLPEASSFVALHFESAENVAAALDCLALSRTRPDAIELLNPPAKDFVAGQYARFGDEFQVPPNLTLPWVVLVGFEGAADAVRWQEDQLIQEVAPAHPWTAGIANERALALWTILTDFQAAQARPVTFKVTFRSSATVQFLEAAQRQPVRWAVQAHAGNGIAYGHAPAAAERAAVESCLSDLRALAVSLGGNLVVRRCPTDWKLTVPVWGQRRGDLWLMQAIKRKLDPSNSINPGRFVDALVA